MSSGLKNKSRAPILVTGAAGFIGAKTIELLLAEGHTVVGADNLNDYYDVRLKNYRTNTLLGQAETPAAPPNLAKISLRAARRLRFDSDKQRFINDDHANSYINQPMRGSWKL